MGNDLRDDIIARIRTYAENGAEREITLGTDIESLGVQSLELTEIIFDIEEAYGVEIELNTVEAWTKLRTVGDVVVAVKALIEAKA